MAYARWVRVLLALIALVMRAKTKNCVCFLGSENCNELNRVDALGYHVDFLEPQPGTWEIAPLPFIDISNYNQKPHKAMLQAFLSSMHGNKPETFQIYVADFVSSIFQFFLSDSTAAPNELIWMVF